MPTPSPAPSATSGHGGGAKVPGGPVDELVFKVVVVGPTGAGKTAMVHRLKAGTVTQTNSPQTKPLSPTATPLNAAEATDLSGNSNCPGLPTVGVDFTSVVLKVTKPKVVNIRLQLWDVGGKDGYAPTDEELKTTLRSADAVCVLFDATSKASLDLASEHWIPKVLENMAGPKATNAASSVEERKGSYRSDGIFFVATHTDKWDPSQLEEPPLDLQSIGVDLEDELLSGDADFEFDLEAAEDAAAADATTRKLTTMEDIARAQEMHQNWKPEHLNFISNKKGQSCVGFVMEICKSCVASSAKRSAERKEERKKEVREREAAKNGSRPSPPNSVTFKPKPVAAPAPPEVGGDSPESAAQAAEEQPTPTSPAAAEQPPYSPMEGSDEAETTTPRRAQPKSKPPVGPTAATASGRPPVSPTTPARGGAHHNLDDADDVPTLDDHGRQPRRSPAAKRRGMEGDDTAEAGGGGDNKGTAGAEDGKTKPVDSKGCCAGGCSLS